MVYFICFILSAGILRVVEDRASWTVERILGVVVALSLPCFLAALRADTIGTDVLVYAKPLFEQAKVSLSFGDYLQRSWVSFWVIRTVNSFEIGFLLLEYAVAACGLPFFVFLGLLEALIVIPVYIAVRQLENDMPTWLGMLVFYFIFFNLSLNMMRQMVAVSFSFLAFICWIKRRRFLSILTFISALLFHQSSFIALIPIAIYEVIYRGNDSKRFRLVFIVVCALSSVLFLPLISSILRSIGFGEYADGYLDGTFHIAFNQVLIRLPEIIISISLIKDGVSSTKKSSYDIALFCLAMTVFDVLLSQFGTVSGQSTRIAYYFSVFQIVAFPLFAADAAREANVKLLFVCIYLIVYWLIYFVYLNWGSTAPFILNSTYFQFLD